MAFDKLPKGAKSQPTKYKLHIPDQDVEDFYQLLRLSKLAPETFESNSTDGKFGLNGAWLANAKAEWEKWDW
jgi:microsomal epoxide hydrolase